MIQKQATNSEAFHQTQSIVLALGTTCVRITEAISQRPAPEFGS